MNNLKTTSYEVILPSAEFGNLVLAFARAKAHIEKTHHLDGCRKARENWRKCNCGKDDVLEELNEILTRN